jgi:hypothetical protein
MDWKTCLVTAASLGVYIAAMTYIAQSLFQS